jgi:transposase-like protein
MAEFDIIVLDVMLPVRDGIEVCRILRQRGIHAPILMLTARDAVEGRVRGLDSGADDYLWLDALTQKVREAGRIVNVSVVVATAVNREGRREVVGVDVGTSEDGAFWLQFLRSLVARGLSGVQLVTSDARRGLKEAIATVFAGASWQRCRTHFMTNLRSRVPRRVQPAVATTVRTIYQQSSPEELHAQHQRVAEQLHERFPQAAALLAEAGPDILAFTAFPVAHWRQIWSTSPLERLNKEIRRGTDVVGILANRTATRPLIGAVRLRRSTMSEQRAGVTSASVGRRERRLRPAGSWSGRRRCFCRWHLAERIVRVARSYTT